LSTRLQERVQKIQELLERLVADSAKGSVIVVEGQKDKIALQELGVKGKIITAKTSRKSFLDATAEIEKHAHSQIILLLDFDRRGKELTKHLTKHMETLRIKTNTTYTKDLQALLGHDVKDIEGLPTYLKTLNKKLAKNRQ
jgi:5S rRNA maturation endonuclease (ribonuclease M5)